MGVLFTYFFNKLRKPYTGLYFGLGCWIRVRVLGQVTETIGNSSTSSLSHDQFNQSISANGKIAPAVFLLLTAN